MVDQDPGFRQVMYEKSYDALLRHHDKKLDAPWKAQGVSHTPWRLLFASRTHPTASTNHRNCRPGWRTRWVQLPPAAHCSTHALARSKHHSGSHWEGASSISRGGALARCRVALELVAGKVWALPKPQRPVAAAAVLVRVHASRVRDHDHTHRARTYRDRGPREQLRYSPTRKPVSKDAALLHLAVDGKEGPAGWT